MATLPDNRLSLRAMTAGDVAGVHALSRAEQWPHRPEDLADMLAVGHGIVAEMAGEIVAVAMWWPCGAGIVTFGMMIVSRRHRGAGLGRITMEAVMDAIGDRAILLNATEEGLPLYRKLGFRGVAEILQHQGAAFSVPVVPLEAGERIRPLGQPDHETVIAMIARATGLERPALMALLLEKARGVVIDRDDEILGIALFRRFGRGYAVGPVVATDAHRARALVSYWIGSRAGEFIRLDLTGDSGLADWLEESGLVRVGRVVTMVRGAEPVVAGPARSFAIVGQSFG